MSNAHQADQIAENLAVDEQDATEVDQDQQWLDLATEAYNSSKSYMDSSLKRQWERNQASFHSRHAPGSKYYTDAYKYRSRHYRSKTRSAIRRNEASAAKAYFSTAKLVAVEPEDESNPQHQLSADMIKELMNYRLDKTIPWFTILVGAYQETQNIGAVVSYQYWKFREIVEEQQKAVLDEEGNETTQTVKTVRVIKDTPAIDLRPPENILISAASSWDDPINSSPFLIDEIPMYFDEIKERMVKGENNEAAWLPLSDGDIMAAAGDQYDSLRRQREGKDRQDSKDGNVNEVQDYRIIWVNRNFIRKEGKEYVFYTLGTKRLLSTPITIQEFYDRDDRPYVMGICSIEAHRAYPSSISQLGEQAQSEINDVANTRMDNVKLAVNKRFYIRRGGNVDYRALMRSAPGSGILMDDITGDVKEEQVSDVTSSAYHEQDRLNLDFDEAVGSFSSSSVQSNRQMNETVGGMELLSGEGNEMKEYMLRTFNETWVEPVLRQIADLIARYETDETVIAIAGRRAAVDTRYGKTDQITWRDFQSPSTLRVAVGFGATDPAKQIRKLDIGMGMVAKYFPDLAQQADRKEIVTEIFGSMGYKDGTRFFPMLQEGNEEDPMVAQLKQHIQKLEEVVKTKQIESQGRMQVEQVRQQGQTEREQMKLNGQQLLANIKAELEYLDKQLKAEMNELARSELLLEQDALIHQKRVTEINLLIAERDQGIKQVEKLETTQTGMDDSRAGVIQRDKYGQLPHGPG